MADYKKMYYTLFNAMNSSTELMLGAMQQAEELYLAEEEPVLVLAEGRGGKKTPQNGAEQL